MVSCEVGKRCHFMRPIGVLDYLLYLDGYIMLKLTLNPSPMRNPFSRSPKYREFSDAEIITMIQAGGLDRRKARNCLFEKFFGLVTSMKKKHRPLTEEAIIVAYAEALIALDRKIFERKFRKEATLNTFFYAIFYKKCIDQLRKPPTNGNERGNQSSQQAKNAPEDSEVEEEVYIEPLPFDPPSPELNEEEKIILQEIEEEEREKSRQGYSQLLEAMKQLKEKCRQLLMGLSEGYDYEELMKIHGYKSLEVTRESVSQCRKKLRKILKDRGLNPDSFF